MDDKGVPRRNPIGWYVLFAVIALGITALLVWHYDEEQRERDRYRQEELDRPGIHELERSLGK